MNPSKEYKDSWLEAWRKLSSSDLRALQHEEELFPRKPFKLSCRKKAIKLITKKKHEEQSTWAKWAKVHRIPCDITYKLQQVEATATLAPPLNDKETIVETLTYVAELNCHGGEEDTSWREVARISSYPTVQNADPIALDSLAQQVVEYVKQLMRPSKEYKYVYRIRKIRDIRISSTLADINIDTQEKEEVIDTLSVKIT